MRLTKSSATQSVDRIVCKLDLKKAENPPEKLGNDEYFRALNSHKPISKEPEDVLSPEVVYMIDKEIRLQARQQRQVEPTEERQKAKKKKPGFSYTQWMKRKNFEEKYKNALMMQALKNKYEKDLLDQQEKEEKTSKNFKNIKKWEQRKIIEILRKKQIEKHSKQENEAVKEQQRLAAEDNYKDWLRKNMIKLKEEKKKKRLQKQKEAEDKKLKEEKAEELRKKTEENFKTWLKQKKKTLRKSSNKETKAQIKLKKPIMLAYSPNRKLAKDNNSYHEDSSGNEESEQSEQKLLKKVKSKQNIFNNFNDLSSSQDEDKQEYTDDFSSKEKIVQESFQDNPGEFEEGSGEYEEGSGEYEEGSDEYEEGSGEFEESYGSEEYESDSSDKANNSY